MSSRESILAAAQRHLSRDPRASIADIAAAASVGRATIHRHFSSREELLHELGTRSLDRWSLAIKASEVEAAIASEDAATIRACMHDLFQRYLADSDDFGFALVDPYLTTAPNLAARSQRLANREIALFLAAQRAGVLRRDLPARWISHAVYGLLVAARDALAAGDVARRDLDTAYLTTFLMGMQA